MLLLLGSIEVDFGFKFELKVGRRFKFELRGFKSILEGG